MSHQSNVVGRNVSRERYKRGWSQEKLVIEMQLRGCYMTRDIVASIETLRCIVTDKQLEFFAAVFGIPIQQLFPPKPHFSGKEPDFREPKPRQHKAKPRLARRRKK